jgi:DNA-binding CsgD family transcriptional regulator
MGDVEAIVVDPGPFTPCESEIARRLCEGECNKIMAAGLNISIRTVDAHLQTMYEKLHLRNLSVNTRCAAILTLVAKGYVRLSVKAVAAILMVNALQFDDQAMLRARPIRTRVVTCRARRSDDA